MIEGRATALLAGPRGREVCLQAAALADPAVESIWSRARGCFYEPADPRLVVELAGALRRTDATAVAELTEPALLRALVWSVGSAMYWQAPWTCAVVAAAVPVVDALHPIAAGVVASAAAEWWWSGMDRERQRCVEWVWQQERSEQPTVDPVSGLSSWHESAAAAELRAPRDPAFPGSGGSGSWWSTPRVDGVLHTTRDLGSREGVGLLLVEEHGGDFEEAYVRPVEVASDARVLEIATADDWVELVRAFPFDASWSLRHDWFRTTERAGAWCLPDWQQAAQHWDGVHLTVAGYLEAAGRALEMGDGRASVVAGFDPDQTFWLREVVRVVDRPRRWRLDGDTDLSYRPVSP